MSTKRFRVAFSFAGEKRDFVGAVAELLAVNLGKKAILYDKFHEAEFARPDLASYLMRLYHQEAELIVVVCCPNYQEKEWTGLEWRAILDRIKKRDDSHIMLCRFQRASMPELFSSAGWVDLDEKSPKETVALILDRMAFNEHAVETTVRIGAARVETALDQAARIAREQALARGREAFCHSERGVKRACEEVLRVNSEMGQIVSKIAEGSEQLTISVESRNSETFYRWGPLTMVIWWHCEAINSLLGSALVVSLKERKHSHPSGEYNLVKEVKFLPDLDESSEFAWRQHKPGGQYLDSSEVAQIAVRRLLDLIDRHLKDRAKQR